MSIMGDTAKVIHLHMMPFGAGSRKPTTLWSNQEDSEVLKVEHPLDPSQAPSIVTTTSYIDSSGTKRVQGAGDLKGTQAYPPKFGEVFASKCLSRTVPFGPGYTLEDLKGSVLSQDPWDDACLDPVLAVLQAT